MKTINKLVAATVMTLGMSTAFGGSVLSDYYDEFLDWEKCVVNGEVFSGGPECGPRPMVKKECPDAPLGLSCGQESPPLGNINFTSKNGELHLLRVYVDGEFVRYVRLVWNGESFDIDYAR